VLNGAGRRLLSRWKLVSSLAVTPATPALVVPRSGAVMSRQPFSLSDGLIFVARLHILKPMTRSAQTDTTTTYLNVTDRPPIFEATRSLGLNDRKIARLMGISPEAIHQFIKGKKPLPIVRALALQFLVTRLTGLVGAAYPPPTRYARRAQIAIDAAKAWCQLARDELEEDTGRVYRAEDIERGVALGERMLARLETQ
jgi:hypothetical protein